MIDFNNFVGEARKLTRDDIASAAHSIEVKPAALAAVLSVESSGTGFDKLGRPRILFEPHIFYRQLLKMPDLQSRAIELGLAYKNWGTFPYPKTSDDNYARLTQAMAIEPQAALRSASWGLGQIMGFNHFLCGATTVEAFVLEAMESEHNQLEQMCHFLVASRLDDELRSLDWSGFARGYNGPGYATNKYDTKLAEAFVTNQPRFS